MKLLKEIIDHWGFVDSKQLPELVKHFPDTPLVIKWGGMPREQIAASKVAKRIEEVEQWDQDYVREVFICADQMSKLKEVFGLTDAS
tara:strand:- start:211 stop:471 length:261 start_codon:yes stop_codon:yes gene_type:complete